MASERKRLPKASAPRAPHVLWRAFGETLESNLDPLGMTTPLVHAQLAWLSHPQELAEAASEFSTKLFELQAHSWRRALGIPSHDVEKPHADDDRFADPLWQESASWDIAKEWYLIFTHQMQDMLHNTPGMSYKDRRRAAFWWRQWLNAVAPTNFLWTNPVAIRKAAETNGRSLVEGMKNFLDDLGAGTVRMTNPNDFTLGKNLATTHGKVVFRNRLLEAIHYAATQDKTHAMPIVLVMPWINKFYVLDLAPRKSLVKFLLDQGFDVYITSWKNPGIDMRDVSFDDYITEGIAPIVETARALSGAAKVHAVGYCIGGAALCTYMAWANRRYPAGEVPVASMTLLATLVDYDRPGHIEVFLDQSSVNWLSKKMAEKGYLDGQEMASAFRLLRSNGLIWHYVVHGYLYGEKPPPFDVLYWNMDTTRMPATMHTWYLHEFYLRNNLIKKDVLTVAGEKIDLERISQPLYSVATEDDHIAPWQQTFRINRYLAGPKRFVLSSSGHILGIVNPVVHPPKREYRVAAAERHDSTEMWRERSEHHAGSWWEDWMAWLKPRSGELVAARPVASEAYPALADAPGTYVLEN